MNTLKNMVKDKKVTFSYYREGELWYETECGFVFPIPLEDAGTATFNHEEKAILLMRWIRKHIAYLNNAKKLTTETQHYDGTTMGEVEN